MKIPKPPKQINIPPDTRRKHLLEWKRLFERISPDIKVFISVEERHDEEFIEFWERRVGYLQGIDSSDAKIFVCLPKETEESYLVGWPYNRMFSDIEIQEDEVVQADNEMEVSYEPRTKPWEYWYSKICKQYKYLNTSIPKPPSERAGD
jgi:hypothetical protein